MSGTTVETDALSGGFSSSTAEHAHISTDGTGHGPIRVTAGVGATSAADSRATYSETERPQWLPRNFNSPEALVASQREAQATITRLSQELATLKAGAPSIAPSTRTDVGVPLAPTQTPPAPVADLTRIAAAALPPATPAQPTAPAPSASTLALSVPTLAVPSTPEPVTPVDLQALSEEWARNGGQLSAASLARLAKQGISELQVNQYIEGQKALAAKHVASLERVAGGSDRLPLVLQWAASNAHPAANRYNMALATGDYEAAALFLAHMSAGYIDEMGRNPKLAIGGVEAGRMAEEQPFLSMKEATDAMADRRYGKDQAYTRSIERRTMAYSALKRAGKAY